MKGAEVVLKSIKKAMDKDFDALLQETFGDEGSADIAAINKVFDAKEAKADKSNDFRSFMKQKKVQA